MNNLLNTFYWETDFGDVIWRWKEDGDPSPAHKSLNYQWWTPKKSELEIVSVPDSVNKQEVKNEIWEDLQGEIEFFKNLYKLHKANKVNKQDG